MEWSLGLQDSRVFEINNAMSRSDVWLPYAVHGWVLHVEYIGENNNATAWDVAARDGCVCVEVSIQGNQTASHPRPGRVGSK
jgi:hypothetical protein